MVSWERGGEGARTRRLKSEGDEMHLPAFAGMLPFPGVLRPSAALWTLGSPVPAGLSLSSSRIEQGDVGRRGLKSHCGAFSFYFPLFQNLDSILEYFLNGRS